MPPDGHLLDATPGAPPPAEHVQQLVEAESGTGTQGILRRWLASDSLRTGPSDPGRAVLISDASGVKISRDNGTTAPTNVINVGTPAGGNLTGTYPNPTLSAAIIDALLPPGTIQAYAGSGFPAGWLPCNGSTVSRTSFAKLFAVIGTTYNTGGEAGDVFRLPDLNGRMILGTGGARPLAAAGGVETGPAHTHPGSHSHGMNSHAHAQTTHTHGQNSHTHDIGGHTHSLNNHDHDISGHSHLPGTHTHTVDINHDHANAVGAAAASPTATNSILNGTGASTTVPASNHVHPVDLPGLGSTSAGSSVPSATNTGTSSALNTGTSAIASGTSSAGNTGGPSNSTTEGASAANTQAATGNTADDSAAHAASYGATNVNLPPYLVATWLIRTG